MSPTIGAKIFSGMVAVSLTFIFAALFILNRFLGGIAEDEVSYTLFRAERAYERFVVLHDNLFAVQARSVAQTPHLKAVMNIADVDHRTVFHTARELHSVVETDLMLLINARGVLLADVGDPTLFGDNLSVFPGVEGGLTGSEYHGIWSYQGSLYQIILTPIVMESQMLGLLVLGYLLDSVAAAEVREFTGSDVLILYAGEQVGYSRERSDSPPIGPEELVALGPLLKRTGDVAGARFAPPFRVILGGKECLAVVVPLGSVAGKVVLFRALDEVESNVDMLRLYILAAGGISIVLALLLSGWLSVKLSRPVRELRDVAEQFGAGHLEKRVGVHSGDELGQLAQSFNMMADNLDYAYQELARFSRRTVQLQEEERRRVARELHDGVNQLLAVVSFGLESIERKLLRRDQTALEEVDRTKQLLDEVIQEIRRISYNLRPSVLDDLGLMAAVRSLCDEFANRTQTRVEMGPAILSETIPKELEITIYRILQEALNNIEKHAEATVVKLHFVQKNARISVIIGDNGKGFNVFSGERESRGAGLNNMKKRAALVDGVLELRSIPHSGTEVLLDLPSTQPERKKRYEPGRKDQVVGGG